MGKSENEKLEFLGDAILNSVTSILLFRKYREKNEGFLSNARSCLVNRVMLTEDSPHHQARRAYVLREREGTICRVIQRSSRTCWRPSSGPSISTAGSGSASRVIRRLFRPYFDEAKLQEKNPKNVLQEYSQKKWGILPKYRITRKDKGRLQHLRLHGQRDEGKGRGQE